MKKSSKQSLPQIPGGRRGSIQLSTPGSQSNQQVSKAVSNRGLQQLIGSRNRRLPSVVEEEQLTESGRTEITSSTFRFVYSEAVEREFRRNYYSKDFGPISAKPTQPGIEIVKLPQLYSDWLQVKELIAKKQEYIKKMKEEYGEIESPNKAKYGRYRLYSRNRTNSFALDSLARGLASRGGMGSRAPSRAGSRAPSRAAVPSRPPSIQRLPSILTSSAGTRSVASMVTLKSES